jgi:hypothetical protein
MKAVCWTMYIFLDISKSARKKIDSGVFVYD